MDSGAIYAAAGQYGALADRAETLGWELRGTAGELRAVRFNWQGPASTAFAELVEALAANLGQASGVFRQVASDLNKVAAKVKEAEDAQRKAQIAAGAGVVITVLAVAQLGLDPFNDAAAVGGDGAAAAATAAADAAEVAAEAEAASAFSAIAELALQAVRGLGAFLAPHLGGMAIAGGQAVFVDLLATGKIDWRDVGSQVAMAGVLGVGTAGLGTAMSRLSADELDAALSDGANPLIQRNVGLQQQFAGSEEYPYNVLTGGPLSDPALAGAPDAVVPALRNSAANTFASGKYAPYQSDQPYLLFKAGDNPEHGSYFTFKPPAGEASVRIDSAVKPQWVSPEGVYINSSPVDEGYVYVVDNPQSTVYVGPTSGQGGAYAGGEIQVHVPGGLRSNEPELKLIARYDINNPPDWVLQLRDAMQP